METNVLIMFCFSILTLPSLAAEDDLLRRANQGSQDATIEIYDLYFQPVYRFVRTRVDDVALAEDITGNVFLKLVQALGTRSAPRKTLRGWLFRVARHEIHQFYEQAKRSVVTTLEEWMPDTSQPDPESLAAMTMDADRVRRAIGMLVPDQQEVLLLRFGEMLDLAETANVMGKSVGAVKSLQFRAVQTLRQVMGLSEEDRA